MLDIVQSLGASYIQVMYDSSTAYATALYHALQKKVVDSKKYNVCIAQSIPITPHDTVSQYVYIMDTLRIKSSAKVVIVLLHTVEINKVMDAILPLLTSEDDFLFLASESWGRRQKIIEGRVKLEGSLVLAQEIAVDKLFERYFAELDLADSMNPWLKSFWEARLNCYMDKSFHRKGKTGPCPERFAESYVQDSRVPFHIQAVYALVKGFDAALTQHCGSPAIRTCQSLTSSRLVSAMHKVELDLYSTGQFSPVFDKNGDGLVGYNVLKISRNLETPEDDVVYKDVSALSVHDSSPIIRPLLFQFSRLNKYPNSIYHCHKTKHFRRKLNPRISLFKYSTVVAFYAVEFSYLTFHAQSTVNVFSKSVS